MPTLPNVKSTKKKAELGNSKSDSGLNFVKAVQNQKIKKTSPDSSAGNTPLKNVQKNPPPKSSALDLLANLKKPSNFEKNAPALSVAALATLATAVSGRLLLAQNGRTSLPAQVSGMGSGSGTVALASSPSVTIAMPSLEAVKGLQDLSVNLRWAGRAVYFGRAAGGVFSSLQALKGVASAGFIGNVAGTGLGGMVFLNAPAALIGGIAHSNRAATLEAMQKAGIQIEDSVEAAKTATIQSGGNVIYSTTFFGGFYLNMTRAVVRDPGLMSAHILNKAEKFVFDRASTLSKFAPNSSILSATFLTAGLGTRIAWLEAQHDLALAKTDDQRVSIMKKFATATSSSFMTALTDAHTFGLGTASINAGVVGGMSSQFMQALRLQDSVNYLLFAGQNMANFGAQMVGNWTGSAYSVDTSQTRLGNAYTHLGGSLLGALQGKNFNPDVIAITDKMDASQKAVAAAMNGYYSAGKNAEAGITIAANFAPLFIIAPGMMATYAAVGRVALPCLEFLTVPASVIGFGNAGAVANNIAGIQLSALDAVASLVAPTAKGWEAAKKEAGVTGLTAYDAIYGDKVKSAGQALGAAFAIGVDEQRLQIKEQAGALTAEDRAVLKSLQASHKVSAQIGDKSLGILPALDAIADNTIYKVFGSIAANNEIGTQSTALDRNRLNKIVPISASSKLGADLPAPISSETKIALSKFAPQAHVLKVASGT